MVGAIRATYARVERSGMYLGNTTNLVLPTARSRAVRFGMTLLLLTGLLAVLPTTAAHADRFGSMTYSGGVYTQTFTQATGDATTGARAEDVTLTYTATGNTVASPGDGAGNGIVSFGGANSKNATSTMFTPNIPTGTQIVGFLTSMTGCRGSGNTNERVTCGNRGTLTLTFSKPIDNPMLAIMGIGGYGVIGTQAYFGISGTLSAPADATISVASGATNLQVVNGKKFQSASTRPAPACDARSSVTDGTAGCGSLQVSGEGITSLTFDLTAEVAGGRTSSTAGTSLGDHVAVLVSLPDQPLPTAVADTAATDSATPITIDVQGNDSAGTGFAIDEGSTLFRASSGWTLGDGGKTATRSGVGTFTVETDGRVTFTPVLGYEGTTPQLIYEFTDSAGSKAWAPITVTVTDPVPDAPPITGPAAGAVTNDSTPTITGTGEPGDTITVSNGATVLGTTTVDEDGNWTFVPTIPLPDGPRLALRDGHELLREDRAGDPALLHRRHDRPGRAGDRRSGRWNGHERHDADDLGHG